MYPVPMEVRVLVAAGMKLPPEKANHSEEMMDKMSKVSSPNSHSPAELSYLDRN